MTREGNKDRGHVARKAVWLSLAVLLFVPHAAFLAATKADDLILHLGERRLYVWSHPCLFVRRSPKRER